MEIPSSAEMIARLRALPSGSALLGRLRRDTPVHLVGGAVRDLLLGERPPDLDLVLEGDALALAKELDPAARVHDRFGTATFSVHGFEFDIACARRETYSRPGALPDVYPASLDQDLLRRDFTMNAIAMALGAPEPGSITAAPGAVDDLRRGLLRVLHDSSFIDDPTRLFRLARYASRLGSGVEAHTAELADAAIAAGALHAVSGARIGAELRLIAREADPIGAFGGLERIGLAQAIHRGLGVADSERARRALDLLPANGRRDLLSLAIATERTPGAELAELLDALAFEAQERDLIIAAVTQAPALAEALQRAERASQIMDAAFGSSPELVALAGALGPEQQARSWLERLRHVRLDINGGDLRQAGVPEGPAIGRALRAALSAKLDGLAPDREAQLARALQAAEGTG